MTHNRSPRRDQVVTSRRTFLQSAAVLSASPLAGRVVFADGRSPVGLDAVVVDSRHAEARTFGVRAAHWGAPLREIEGDITALWQHELLARWKAKPLAVAGLTERSALFLLENLAFEHGLRVVFEAEHLPRGKGAAAHRLIRTANRSLALALDRAGAGWPLLLADALVAGAGVAARNFGPTGAGMAAYLGEPTKLYSWIIAPRSAA
jgi:hypothetical protein